MRVGTSLFGVDLSAQHSLMQAMNQLTQSSIRLSTMKRINSGSDDPAGLISVGALEAELASLEAASRNSSRAVGAIRTADTGLAQVGGLLRDIKANIIEVAGGGLSDAEIGAKQIEIDAALEALNRIGASTSYGGQKLLDGSGGYNVSGVNSDQVTNIEVYQNVGGGTQALDIEVTAAATSAELTFTDADATLDADVTLEVQGNDGITVLEFDAGTTLTQIAEAINLESGTTGVSASVSGNDLTISSEGVGSEAMVSVEALEGTFDVGPSTTAYGTDVVAEVNGVEFTGEGNEIHVSTSALQADIELEGGFTGQVDPITVSGGAMTYVFSPDVSDTSTLALPNINAAALGGSAGRLSDLASGGSASMTSGNLEQAMAIVDKAESQVLGARARAGAFEKYTIGSSQNLLDSMEESVSEGLSMVRDTDVAKEVSNLVRSQILVQSGISMISLTNSRRSFIGSLFQGIT
ncbi:MAG: flagellin [Pirellulales bacterium]|nr:flagellin [Pirellulales bacterium]